MISRVLFYSLLLCLSGLSHGAEKLKVITTLPDLAEVARVVGGDKVSVDSLLKGTEDAHFLDAIPTYIRMVANADVVCSMGLELEVGWLPKILEKSSNAKIQPGGQGYCETGTAVVALEKPSVPMDRSMGDVHAHGNPHFNLSPKALSEAAVVVEAVLSKSQPSSATEFKKGLKKFQDQMKALKEKTAAKIKNRPSVIEYHKEFTYFFDSYGLKSVGSIEDKPGVPPSGIRLANIAKQAKDAKVCLAFAALYTPENQLKKFSEISGIAYKKMPSMVQKDNEAYNTIEKLHSALADALISCESLATKDKG